MTKINFSGNIDEVKKQIEQTIATYELLGNRSSINFDQWFEQWEQGLPAAIENRALGNYQLTGDRKWRDDANKRPRWREWGKEAGIIAGEYWRDRSDENSSIPLIGTAEQLIQHIVQLEYEGGGSSNKEDADFTGGGEVSRKGRPQLFLYFVEDDSDVEPGYKPICSEISMRLMDQTEATINQADLNRYTSKIQTTFGVGGGKVWRRGKDMAVYTDWENGYQLQLLVRSRAEGEELIKSFLLVQNVSFLRKKYFYNENQDASNAYPTDPGNQLILGKEIKKARRRPIAEIRFQAAWISLASIRKPIYLIDTTGDNKVFSD